MREFQQKQRVRRLVRSPITLGILAVALLALLWPVGKIYLRAREAETTRDRIEAELSELEAHESALAARVEELETPRGAEEELRRKLNVQRPGEKVLVIVRREAPAATSSEPSVFRRFRDIFKLW